MLLGLAQRIQQVKFLLNDNSTTILTGMGVVGTLSTTFLTGRATLKAARIIDEEERQRKDKSLTNMVEHPLEIQPLTNPQKIKLVWREYIPPFGSCVITITCIVMANRIASTKIAALTVASGISERALQEYKSKVFDKLGEREEQKIHDAVAQDRVNKYPPSNKEIILAGTGEVLCYDMYSGRYFQSSIEEIKRAENKVNHELLNFMYVSLSEFYDEIGLPPTSHSDQVGWNANSRVEVKFSTAMSPDSRPVVTIDFVHHPITDYHSKFLQD